MQRWEALEPKTRKFIQSLEAQDGPPIYTLSVEEARRVLERAQASVKVPLPEVEIRDETLPCGPSGAVSVRIVRPKGVTETLPVAMYFHGGGWVLGSRETHDRLIRDIAQGAGVAVVFVNYTPSPEARFPTAIEEAYDATRYIAEKGEKYQLDTSRIAVVGDSVGGNMATVVAFLAKDRGGPEIRAQILLYPVTDANFDTLSYREFAGGPWLTREAMKWFWDNYLPDKAAREHPMASPLRASIEQLRDLPKTLVFTDENDVLRDEGEAYARKLMNAGVDVTVARFNGTIHDFAMLNAIADTPAAIAAVSGTCWMLQVAFGRAGERAEPGAGRAA